MYNYIVIEGNIGAGKTSLATKLADDLDASLVLEQFEENSFLPKFYKDPERYAFPLELSFLADRYQQLKDHFRKPDLFKPITVSDYFIYKSLIFAGQNLESAELTLYKRMFEIVSSVVPRPDLLVYLYLPTDQTKQNIITRGRSYEQQITLQYLDKIQSGYMEFLKQLTDWRILLVETSGIDFVWRGEDYKWISEIVRKDYPVGITRIGK